MLTQAGCLAAAETNQIDEGNTRSIKKSGKYGKDPTWRNNRQAGNNQELRTDPQKND